MTPDDPRYYDPRFSDSGEPLTCRAIDCCSVCRFPIYSGDLVDVDYYKLNGVPYCDACWSDLPWCGDGEHRFTGEVAVEFNGFRFCSEEHAVPYREDEVHGALEGAWTEGLI